MLIVTTAATYYRQMQEINGMANAKLGLLDIGRAIKGLVFAMLCFFRIYEGVGRLISTGHRSFDLQIWIYVMSIFSLLHPIQVYDLFMKKHDFLL